MHTRTLPKMFQMRTRNGYTFMTDTSVYNRYVLWPIIEWCTEQFGEEFAGSHWWECNCAHCDYGFVNFKEAAPAMLFKMRWC